VVHAPSVGAETVIEVAVTVPLVSAAPRALTHCPTTRAEESAALVVEYVVEPPTVTVFVVELSWPIDFTVIVVPETAVT
jgi:hypothetical protein